MLAGNTKPKKSSLFEPNKWMQIVQKKEKGA